MRAAIPVWQGRVSPVFDTASRLLLCDVVAGAVDQRREEALAAALPEERAARLAATGAEVLICGAISRRLAALVAAAGVRTVPFVAGGVDEVLAAFVAGRLSDPVFIMPGCCGRRGRRCGRRFHGNREREL